MVLIIAVWMVVMSEMVRAAGDGARSRRQGHRRHLDPGVDDLVKLRAGGALVEHLRNQCGDEQRPRHIHDQQQDGDGAQLPVRFEKTKDQFHCSIYSFCVE